VVVWQRMEVHSGSCLYMGCEEFAWMDCVGLQFVAVPVPVLVDSFEGSLALQELNLRYC